MRCSCFPRINQIGKGPPTTHQIASGLLVTRVGGLVLDGGLSGYTAGGLFFELLSSGGAIALLRAD